MKTRGEIAQERADHWFHFLGVAGGIITVAGIGMGLLRISTWMSVFGIGLFFLAGWIVFWIAYIAARRIRANP